MRQFHGKVAIQQRVLPAYRAPLFEAIAARCPEGFVLFVGEPREKDAVHTARNLKVGQLVAAQNQHLFKGAAYLCRQRGFKAMLEDFQPDVLLVEANPRNIETPRAIEWMHKRNKAVIGWGLGAPPLAGPLSRFRQRSRKNLLSRFDAVISYSQRGAREYAMMGFPADNIHVAYNAATPAPENNIKSGFYKKSGVPTILFVGRLQQRKRLDLLFKACAAQDKPPELIIIGGGPAEAELKGIAQLEYPQANFVGELHGEALREYYKKADLFVLPGTGGLAIQQAMANGLPVIVAEGDGTQDDLVSPQNGWLIRPGDQDHLTSTLREALSDLAVLADMGEASYLITKNKINLEKMVDVFIDVFCGVTETS